MVMSSLTRSTCVDLSDLEEEIKEKDPNSVDNGTFVLPAAAIEKKRKREEGETGGDKSKKDTIKTLIEEVEKVKLPTLPEFVPKAEDGWWETMLATKAEYHPEFAVYDTCDEVRKKSLEFIAKEGMSTSAFCKAIGNIQSKSWNLFMGSSGRHDNSAFHQPGANNVSYYKAYGFLEKVRILRGEPKSAERAAFEVKSPRGYALKNDDGERWILG